MVVTPLLQGERHAASNAPLQNNRRPQQLAEFGEERCTRLDAMVVAELNYPLVAVANHVQKDARVPGMVRKHGTELLDR
jgi:hypothetical protein